MQTISTPVSSSSARQRRPWAAPHVEDLPHLTRLTLQTGAGDEIPGNCGTGGSGSTCF